MAAQTPGSNPSEKHKTHRGSNLKRWLLRLLMLALLAGVGAVGWRQFREFRKHRMVARARMLIDQKDYPQAMLSARRALQLNPRDATVVHMMVELAKSAKTKEELFWHRMLSELEPGVAANNIAWADCALRYSERLIAEQALGRVDEAGKKTAAFNDAAGRLALLANEVPEAERHFTEALRLEPGNAEYRVHQAMVRLYSDKPEQQQESRETLEKYIADPNLRPVAARALLDDLLYRKRDWSKALEVAKQVQSAPDATFGERMVYLGLLRTFQRPEFHSYLLEQQELAATNPEYAGTLITWMGENTLVMVAVSWAKSLPEVIATKQPVPPALGECFAMLHDWESLKALVSEGNWEYAEFLRLAFLARVQRESGDLLSSRNSWIGAVKATANRADAILMLTAHATKWGWDNEVQDVLWTLARRNTDQKPAIDALYKSYTESGNTRGLLNVSTRMLEINGKDPIALNNVVLLSLLLNTNVERALSLAEDVYRLQPKNPGIISTYAYSLHIRGKTDEGIALMRTLDEQNLNDPSAAAYFSAMLVESEKPETATKYIEIAQTGKLLPEEMALVKTARETLLRRKADQSAPQ